MSAGAFVSSLQVSTERQGRSGLGLDARRRASDRWLASGRQRLPWGRQNPFIARRWSTASTAC